MIGFPTLMWDLWCIYIYRYTYIYIIALIIYLVCVILGSLEMVDDYWV